MSRFRSRKRTFHTCEQGCCFEDIRLLDTARLIDEAIVVELRKDRTHTVIAQTASMVRAGNEAGAERVHLRERGDLAHIAEIVSELAARKRWAACWLNGDEVRRILAFELVRHERRHKTTQVRSAACAADQDIRLHADLLERRFRLEADDGLVQQHLIEHRT